MLLNEAGQMVHDEWLRLLDRFSSIQADQLVDMPNHLHGILMFGEEVSSVGAPLVGALLEDGGIHTSGKPSLGAIVGAYKSLTTVTYIRRVRELLWAPFHERLWQRNYYEHVIRDENSFERICQYIEGNPSMWEHDPENIEAAAITQRGQPQGLPRRERWMV